MDRTLIEPDALEALAGDFLQAADDVSDESARFQATTGLQPSDLGAPPAGEALYARYERQRADAHDGCDGLRRELLSYHDRLMASAGNYSRADSAASA
jgi:hypothetical protein